MVSVSTKVPVLSDGGVDTLQWCARMGQAHDRLDEAVLLNNTQWLAGYGDELLRQSLELAEMVADLRLDQPAVLAALTYSGFRKNRFDEQELESTGWCRGDKAVRERGCSGDIELAGRIRYALAFRRG